MLGHDDFVKMMNGQAETNRRLKDKLYKKTERLFVCFVNYNSLRARYHMTYERLGNGNIKYITNEKRKQGDFSRD